MVVHVQNISIFFISFIVIIKLTVMNVSYIFRSSKLIYKRLGYNSKDSSFHNSARDYL